MMKSFTSSLTILALFASCIWAASLPAYPDFFTVTSDGVLSRYNSFDISTATSSIPITGLAEDDVVLDIDIRPSNGALYAIALDRNLSVSSLYTIDASTGAASLVGLMTGCTLYPYPSTETPRYGMDFDPVNDNIRIVGQDTQNFQVDPSTGACTKGTNLFFNGPSGRGSTPSRAVAFTNNIVPTTTTSEYILTGVHLTIVNTADFSGCYKIRSEDVIVDGPFDIHTRQVGTAQINVPLLITPTYDSVNYAFDYSNVELRSISLETGVQETIGTFAAPAAGVYFYGMATIPVGWTGPTSA